MFLWFDVSTTYVTKFLSSYRPTSLFHVSFLSPLHSYVPMVDVSYSPPLCSYGLCPRALAYVPVYAYSLVHVELRCTIVFTFISRLQITLKYINIVSIVSVYHLQSKSVDIPPTTKRDLSTTPVSRRKVTVFIAKHQQFKVNMEGHDGRMLILCVISFIN